MSLFREAPFLFKSALHGDPGLIYFSVHRGDNPHCIGILCFINSQIALCNFNVFMIQGPAYKINVMCCPV